MSYTLPSTSREATCDVFKAGTNQSAIIRKRGISIPLTVEKRFNADGNKRSCSHRLEAVSVIAPIAPTEPSAELTESPKKARKKRTKPQRPEQAPAPLETLKWLTVAQASLRYPSFSEKALRHLVAQAEAYSKNPKCGLRSNGFLPCVVRPAGQRKILIDAERFEQWLSSFSVRPG